MLLGMEAYARSMVNGQRANIIYIYLQAKEQIIVPKFAPKPGNAAHSFEERCLSYQEMARPLACNGNARHDVLREFVSRMDPRLSNSVKIYQMCRSASSGAAIIPTERQADEYETDIFRALRRR